MNVEIVSPAGMLWKGIADHVRVPAHDGDMGILGGHTPFVSLLSPGRILVTHEGSHDREFEVDGGFVTIDEDHVYILIDNGYRITQVR